MLGNNLVGLHNNTFRLTVVRIFTHHLHLVISSLHLKSLHFRSFIHTF